MMKKVPVFLIAIFCLTALTGCHFFWKHYRDRTNEFSVSLPRSWQIVTDHAPAALIALAPLQGKNDRFRENLTVVPSDLPNDEVKEMFWEYNKKIILSSMPGYKSQIKEGELFAGMQRGQYMAFTVTKGDVKLRIKTVAWFRGLRVYSVTCSAEYAQYPKYEKAFDKILSSFNFYYTPHVAVKTKPKK